MNNWSIQKFYVPDKKDFFLVMTLFCFLAAIFPGLALIILAVSSRSVLSEKFGIWFSAIAIVLFLTLFNCTKYIDGDWSWYVIDYVYFSQVDLVSYLENAGQSIRVTEPIYYAFSSILSQLSDGNILILTLGVTMAIYLTYIVALEKLLSWYKLPQFAAASCILFGVLAGVTFTLSTQLVRQYIASSILFLFFVTILEARYHFAVFLFILGILIHNTFILPAMFLTMCCLIWRQPFVKRHLFWTIAILPALGYLLGEFIASEIPASAFSNAITLDDGSISVSAYIFDGALFLLIMFGLLYQKDKHQLQTLNTSATVVLFLAVWAGLMYGARDVSIFSLRFYFYIEWFRVIGIISVVQLIVFRWKQEGLVFFVIPFALLILGLRVHYSPWDYGGDVLDHLFGSISWWVDRLNQSLNQI